MNAVLGANGRERFVCGATKRDGSGAPCRLPAGHGTSHPGYGRCKRHGGSTPDQVDHARRLMAEHAAREFGIPIKVSAQEALTNELWVAVGQVEFYRARVRELTSKPNDAMINGVTRVARTTRTGREQFGGIDTNEQTSIAEARAHVWVQLLHQAERHLLDVAAVCAKLGIEQQAVDAVRMQGELLMRIILVFLERLGIDRDDARVPEVLPGVIREVTSGRPEQAGHWA